MTCEICDTATATMWVRIPVERARYSKRCEPPAWVDTNERRTTILSCDDCGPQLGYKILAPLEPSNR